ncbi:MAG: membrane protein insertion efficiency factor YidD [Clostridia bacterium]|nr:membrane protein insertion efficiency factor YidD [Clostridia bacterium]
MKKIVAIVREIAVLPIRFYQKFISPLTGAHCKYYPTCSAYALTAVRKHGIFYGGGLAVWRLLRCNPWSKGGIDYVPEKKFWKK